MQTAAEWCFSNPGREMELLSLEEEVAMWLQDLEIQEAEIETNQADLFRETDDGRGGKAHEHEDASSQKYADRKQVCGGG